MKISLLEPLGVSEQLIAQLSKKLVEQGHQFISYPDKTTDIDQLKERAKDSDIVIIANNPFPDEVVESCPNLKLLDVAFTGIDHIGQAACKKNHVTVCNAAGYSNETVAELTLCMAISLLRNITFCDKAVREGKTSAGFLGQELKGKTIGIIGTGNIGIMTAKLFLAFGCQVIAYSRSQRKEALDLGISYVSLDDLLENSDIVSLHMPLNQQTKGFIDKEKIAKMKPSAFFINCARGAIVDNQALSDALNQNKIAGAAIDVFDMEPPLPEDYPLLHAKNTLLTPHVAFASQESMIRRANIVFDNLYAYLDNQPKNVVKL